MLSNQQFERARRLALSLAGIQLVERHRELLRRRSERLGITQGAALDELVEAAEAGDAGATRTFVSLLTTRFTAFFRHPRHFDVAAQRALQGASGSRRARLWSAGTATGEEAWSLAMALIEAFGSDDPPASVLATDVDVGALTVAERGEYGEMAMKSVSPERRERFMDEAASRTMPAKTVDCSGSTRFSNLNAHPASYSAALLRSQSAIKPPPSKTLARRTSRQSPSTNLCVSPLLRRLVEFRPLNLADAEWAVTGHFDVILCRNVLMYLDAGYRYAVLERMASLLAPGGLLLLDPTEHPGKAGHWFALAGEGVYSRRPATCPPHRERRALAGLHH